MEENRPMDFKALRAKFQEEGFLAQSKSSRPVLAEKPKHVPPPGSHCSSVVSGINTAVENNNPLVPRVFFRDDLRASGGKRALSFPPRQTSPSSQLANGDGSTRYSLKDRNMPLVLPVLPVKDCRMAAPAEKDLKQGLEPGKEVLTENKFKKVFLLPFKSVKTSKVSSENGEEPTYADLTNRPCSAPGELPSMEKQSLEDRVSLQSEQSAPEYRLSSPENSITPPPCESHVDSDNRIISSLERAKKTFSRRHLLISSKTKILCSPDNTRRDKTSLSPSKNADGLGADVRVSPPVCLQHLACISARPFFRASNSAKKPAFDKQRVKEKAEHPSMRTVEHHPQSIPLKMLLPDLWTLGSVPAKPPRPPVVDLSSYQSIIVKDKSAGRCQTPSEEERSVSSSVLDGPEFPDFENSELETAVDEAVDIAELELEVLNIPGADFKIPINFEGTACETPEPALSVWDLVETSKRSIAQDLNLGSPNIIPLEPTSFPETINLSELPELPLTELQSQSKEAAVDCFANSCVAHLGAAEKQPVPGETELSRNETSNHEIQTHLSQYQQDRYYEKSDNVYEDVENVKFLSGQVSTKQKNRLKNPYADNHPAEDLYVNKWSRHPWGIASAQHAAHLGHHVLSKEHSSPSTADYKEQRKREKQRLEKERKEQKEREKKENEMKKKFKVTGDEEPMYHAKVMVGSKVRKNDLPVKSGDTVGIIRTTNCPKGKWLARDANHKYGYISVMNVELNIKEMLELGKKAQAAGRGGNLDSDTISIGSRSSSHPVLTSSFTDDSEEWACEDDTLSPFNESHSIPQQTASEPEMSCIHVDAQHTLSDSNLEDLHTQTRHEALQKLATFFQNNKDELGDIADGGQATPTNAEASDFLYAVEEPPYPEQEVDFTEMELLPPPPLYADDF